MDNSIETPEKQIELFVLLNQEYISEYIQSDILSKCDNSRHLFFMGWKTIIHSLKSARHMHLSIKDTYTVIKKTISIFIEYIEQMIKPDSEYDSNGQNSETVDFGKIFIFIHKKVFDDETLIAMTTLIQISEMTFLQMIKITEILLLLNNTRLNPENRLFMCNRFLQSYILLFINDHAIYYCNVLEFLLEKMNMEKDFDFDHVTSFLTEYYLIVSRSRIQPLTESIINDIYVNKYYSQIEEFGKMISLIKQEKGSKAFLKWFFVK